MVSLSLRLPKSLLDWVRAQARTERTKPTQLIRRWIEERRLREPSLEQRVRRLEDLVQLIPILHLIVRAGLLPRMRDSR